MLRYSREVVSAPDDHFTAGPHCRVTGSGSGRVGRAGGCPTIGAGIVSPAGVQQSPPISAPDDHFTAGPHCRVIASGSWVRWSVLVAVQLSVLGLYLPPVFRNWQLRYQSAPDDHFTAGPDCRVTSRAVGALVVLVAVQLSVLGLYLPPVFKTSVGVHCSAPDDHFTAGPDCRVLASGSGCVAGAGGCPTIRAPDCISRRCLRRAVNSAPDDHFTAGPDCRVTVSGRGRVGGAGGCPTIRAGIVSPAGVQRPLNSPPQTIISLPVQTAV